MDRHFPLSFRIKFVVCQPQISGLSQGWNCSLSRWWEEGVSGSEETLLIISHISLRIQNYYSVSIFFHLTAPPSAFDICLFFIIKFPPHLLKDFVPYLKQKPSLECRKLNCQANPTFSMFCYKKETTLIASYHTPYHSAFPRRSLEDKN